MSVKVASTSTSCLDYYNKPHDIDIIRIKLLDHGKELLDGTEITADDFYARLRKEPSWIPKTSQPSVGDLVTYFEGLAKQGYKEAFVTTLSKELSGTFNSVNQAADLVKDLIKVTAYDTKTVCFSEGYIALEADRLFKEGKSTEEVIERLNYLRDNNTIFFAVDDLTHLYNNGRLSGAQAFFGKLLKIKPILQVQSNGKIVSIEKMRNIKNALKSIAQFVRDYTQGREYYAHIVYAGNPGLKAFFEEVLKEELGLEGLYEAPSTPVVGAHIGPDVVGIGVFLK
jgi:DegV family protein with EDD domain